MKKYPIIPKICNRIGEAIIAKYGVTQGRQTSTSLFSFEVQDMPKAISVPASVLNDNNLLQLADDSALLAEERVLLCKVFEQCLKFSEKDYLYTNVDKTVFLHLSENMDTELLVINENTVITPALNN